MTHLEQIIESARSLAKERGGFNRLHKASGVSKGSLHSLLDKGCENVTLRNLLRVERALAASGRESEDA